MARWKTWVLSSGSRLRPKPPAFDAAALLPYLFPADADFFNKQAEAAAESRRLGGVHFCRGSGIYVEN